MSEAAKPMFLPNQKFLRPILICESFDWLLDCWSYKSWLAASEADCINGCVVELKENKRWAKKESVRERRCACGLRIGCRVVKDSQVWLWKNGIRTTRNNDRQMITTATKWGRRNRRKTATHTSNPNRKQKEISRSGCLLQPLCSTLVVLVMVASTKKWVNMCRTSALVCRLVCWASRLGQDQNRDSDSVQCLWSRPATVESRSGGGLQKSSNATAHNSRWNVKLFFWKKFLLFSILPRLWPPRSPLHTSRLSCVSWLVSVFLLVIWPWATYECGWLSDVVDYYWVGHKPTSMGSKFVVACVCVRKRYEWVGD